MDRGGWRTLGAGLGLSALSILLALALAAVPIESIPQEAVFMAVLWPLFFAVHGITRLLDYLGPSGLAEPWSHYAPVWVLRAVIGVSIGLAVGVMAALAKVAGRWGGRVAFGTWLTLVGLAFATNGLSESIAESVGSLQGLSGLASALAGLYLVSAGMSSRIGESQVARLAALTCLSAALVAGAWLAYVAWFSERS
jgi:hypothetical protein